MSTETKNYFKLDKSGKIEDQTMPTPTPASEVKTKTDNSKYFKAFDYGHNCQHYYKVSDHGILHINATTYCINKLDDLGFDVHYSEPVEITKDEFNVAKYTALKNLDII